MFKIKADNLSWGCLEVKVGKFSMSLYGNGALALWGSDSGGNLFGWGIWIIIIQWMKDAYHCENGLFLKPNQNYAEKVK